MTKYNARAAACVRQLRVDSEQGLSLIDRTAGMIGRSLSTVEF